MCHCERRTAKRAETQHCTRLAGENSDLGERDFAVLIRANADDVNQFRHKDLSVAYSSGRRSFLDRVDGRLQLSFANGDFQAKSGLEGVPVLGPSKSVSGCLLATLTSSVAYGEPNDINVMQSVPNGFEPMRADDCFDFIHSSSDFQFPTNRPGDLDPVGWSAWFITEPDRPRCRVRTRPDHPLQVRLSPRHADSTGAEASE